MAASTLGNSETNWPFSLSNALLLPISLLTNTLSLLYILFKLKINARVSNVLIMDTSSKLVLTLIATTAFFIAYIPGNPGLKTCGIYLGMLVMAHMTSFVFPAITSVVRLHMATQMANQQHFKEGFMNAVTGVGIVFLTILCACTLMFIFVFEIPISPLTLKEGFFSKGIKQ